jgi:hypothetical protein
MSDRIRTVTATVPASVCPDPARLDPQEPGWGVLGMFLASNIIILPIMCEARIK